jgi:Mg-chelatase subunit ChlD
VLFAVLCGVADAAPKKRKGPFADFIEASAPADPPRPKAPQTQPAREDRETDRTIIFVIDRSASMDGPKLDAAKRLVRTTTSALGEDDLVAVIASDDAPSVVVRLTRATNQKRIEQDVARLRSGGSANLLAGLKEAFDIATSVTARQKAIVLVTDAEVAEDGIHELASDLRASRISLLGVGMPGADRSVLSSITTTAAGRVHMVDDTNTMPDLGIYVPAKTTAPTEADALSTWLSVVLLIDRSAPMAGAKLDAARAAAQKIGHALEDDDQVALLAFDTRVTYVLRAVCAVERTKLTNALERVKAGGNADLAAALREALRYMEHAPERRVIVLFTDARSSARITAALRAIRDAYVTLIIVGLPGADRVELGRLADEANGGVFMLEGAPGSQWRAYSLDNLGRLITNLHGRW